MAEHRGAFPHPLYRKYVLEPAFRDASDYHFEDMIRANRAHVIMLQDCGVISAENAKALINGLKQIHAEGIESFQYQPGVEDLFFAVEGRLIDEVGSDFGGNLQLARSRNDLGYGLTRLAIRTAYIEFAEFLLSFSDSVLALAREHVDTVMPGYTHTQPAQPTTFAHYLCGVLESMDRMFERLMLAYDPNNQSPLGAAALTGTGHPIDRALVAELLGFDRLILSTQDSIGAGDNLTDAAGLLSTLGVFLSRMSKDFIFWCTQESGAVRIDDSFIQISSIMPQKRNPVVIEHLRARISRMMGLAQGIILQCHNIPYGDTQDVEDEMAYFLYNAFHTSVEVLDLYAAVFKTLHVNKERMREQAESKFITVTEMADTLVRALGLPFRQAHKAVSTLVQYGLDNQLSVQQIPYEKLNAFIREVSGKDIGINQQQYNLAMSAQHFVDIRTVTGGASAAATNKTLDILADRGKTHQAWFAAAKMKLKEADRKLESKEAEIQ